MSELQDQVARFEKVRRLADKMNEKMGDAGFLTTGQDTSGSIVGESEQNLVDAVESAFGDIREPLEENWEDVQFNYGEGYLTKTEFEAIKRVWVRLHALL